MAEQWTVTEFDADQQPIASWDHVDETEAREWFTYVTRERSQRSDVVQRARAAALLQDGQVVQACSIRPTRRAPWVGAEQLRHLDVETREGLHRVDLLAARLVLAGLRVDGEPRVDPTWARVRSVACQLWDTVRGRVALGPDEGGWWVVEWSCRCVQAERSRSTLHRTCPYHDTPVTQGPTFALR